MNAEMHSADADLEYRIEHERLSMTAAYAEGDPDRARAHFDTMTALIRQRSPERIAQMERDRGLR